MNEIISFKKTFGYLNVFIAVSWGLTFLFRILSSHREVIDILIIVISLLNVLISALNSYLVFGGRFNINITSDCVERKRGLSKPVIVPLKEIGSIRVGRHMHRNVLIVEAGKNSFYIYDVYQKPLEYINTVLSGIIACDK